MESYSFQGKDEEVLWCEQCLKRNIRKKLHLYQINFEESIFLCPSKKCCYPLKEENILKFIRKRKSSELGLLTSKKLKNDTDKKLSKKTRVSSKNRLLSDIKNHRNDHTNRSSFSSSSNDFVDDLMDVSLEALDTPAMSVNINEKELKMSFIHNEIGSAPTAFSEDMFWNEVFSPDVPNSSAIVEVMSSISNDGSIEKKSDIEEVTLDLENNYPLHNNCQPSDSHISQQNNFDTHNRDLLMQTNNVSDIIEMVSAIPCTSEIHESDVEVQQNNCPKDDEIILLQKTATDNENNNTQNSHQSNSKDNQANYNMSHNVNLLVKSNNDVFENAEESAISCTQGISEEKMVDVQQKGQPEKNDETILPKEATVINEKSCSLVTYHQSAYDKNQQSDTHTCLDLSKQPNIVMPKNTEEDVTSEISETQDIEIEQNSKIVFSLNDNNRVYPLWRNRDSLCWLDATLCLLVHNHTLKNYIEQLNGNGDCHIKKVVRTYEQAVSLVNNELPTTSENPSTTWENLLTLMNSVREDTFTFLQKTMHCKKGKNDSPVFSFPLLVREKKAIHELFLMDYRWELLCVQCGKKKIHRHKKTLPTFPSVAEDFSMLNASFLRPCFYCEAPEQRRYMRFDKLPGSFTVHFMQGLPSNNISQYDFTYNGIEYKITAVVQYLLQPTTHFVTWVRNVEGNLWLCCDDLQDPNTAKYNDDPPVLHPSEIHIVMWERQTSNICIEDKNEIVMQSDISTDDLVDSTHNSPRSLIIISSDESDQSDGSTEIHSEMKEIPTIASKENDLKPVLSIHNDRILSSMEEKGSLDSQKIHDENNDVKDNVVVLSEKIQSDVYGHSLKKEDIIDLNKHVDNIESNNLGCIGLSEADSDTDITFPLMNLNNNSNICTSSIQNLKDCSKTSETIIVEPAENNEELLYLSETEIEQTVEVTTSNYNANNQKNTDNCIEYVIAFGANGSNLRNYSRKNSFSLYDKKINNSNGHNTKLSKSDIMKGLCREELKKESETSDGNICDDTGELTFQMELCDPSLTTNSNIMESLNLSKVNDDETCYSIPYFVKNNVKNEEMHKSHNTKMGDFIFDLPYSESHNKETNGFTVDSLSAVKEKSIQSEISNNYSTETAEAYEAEQSSNNQEISKTVLQNNEMVETIISTENICNPSVLANLQTTDSFISNAGIGDATCVEICKSVPLDAPIENGSRCFIVEVESLRTDQTSQIIVLNTDVVDIIESDEMDQTCMQDTNHVKDESNKILPPNTLHIVVQNDMPIEVVTGNGDALNASTSNVTDLAKLKKPRSRRKKVVEADVDNGKSNPDLEKFPGLLSESAAMLLERISKISGVIPKKHRRKASEKKTKIQEKKIDLLKESKSALDFSENMLNSFKVLSSLNRYSSEQKTTLNRGRPK